MRFGMVASTVAILAGTGSSIRSRSTAPCDVVGTWELVTSRADGNLNSLNGARWLFIVNRSHWAQIAQRDDARPIDLGDFGRFPVYASAGTYTVRADTFVTRTTASVMPDMRGDSLKYTCQVTGVRWLRSTHTFGMHLEEELRRVVP